MLSSGSLRSELRFLSVPQRNTLAQQLFILKARPVVRVRKHLQTAHYSV